MLILVGCFDNRGIGNIKVGIVSRIVFTGSDLAVVSYQVKITVCRILVIYLL